MVKKNMILPIFVLFVTSFAMETLDIENQINVCNRGSDTDFESDEISIKEEPDEEVKWKKRFRIFYKNWPKDQEGNKLTEAEYRAQLIKRLKASDLFEQYLPIYESLIYNIGKMNEKKMQALEKFITNKFDNLERSIGWKTGPIYEKVRHLSKEREYFQLFMIMAFWAVVIGGGASIIFNL